MATTMNNMQQLMAAQEKYRLATEALRRAEQAEKTARRELYELRKTMNRSRSPEQASLGSPLPKAGSSPMVGGSTTTIRVWNNLTGQHEWVPTTGGNEDEDCVKAY